MRPRALSARPAFSHAHLQPTRSDLDLRQNFLSRGWLGAFRIKGGRVYLRKTGNSAAVDRALLAEVASWLVFQAAVAWRASRRRRRAALWFTPDVPQHWYLVRAAAALAGIGVARSADAADAAFFFEDTTVSIPPDPRLARHFNFGCGDISKSRVAALSEAAFGGSLAVDPATWVGDAVEKSEANGTHDGRIVRCPAPRAPGKAYQRLIDTVDADGLATDLRVHCIGGRPVVVWIKKRPAAARFLPPNTSVTIHAPAKVFDAAELKAIARFCALMRLEWGALDILRENGTGRLHVVDVNKTDAGPITALTLTQKLASTEVLATALAEMVVQS